MRVLLSTIGSRGDVQPLVALALQLMDLGQEVRVCAPPDFREWSEGLGIPFAPLGPELRWTAKPESALVRPSAEQIRQLIEGTVATQFETIPVNDLGIGRALPPGVPTTNSLASALEHSLHSDVAARAHSVATEVCRDGALAAAQRLIGADRGTRAL